MVAIRVNTARLAGLALCYAAAVLLAVPVSAHDAPGDVVHAITHRIETNGPTARLLSARATEYEYLGQREAAIADFEAALALQPRYGLAIAGLAQCLLRGGQLERAAAVAEQGLALEDGPEREAPYHAIVAQARARAERWEDALPAWRAALASPRPEVDWFLGEAEALARLGRHAERAEALSAARARNPSAVLHRTWVWALVDAGRAADAMPEIEANLARAQWKSTWLLLRARVHASQGDREAQHADARAALAEISARWNAGRAGRDPQLMAYAALGFGLLGETEIARDHLEKARALGVPGGWLSEFEALIAPGSP
ncbi:MAG: tetratricopeptide repeat protein [Candidatus Hydrogenedentes bacterium]|nr:tetratricopeptide repeat protein [Candidatus Hydrogenedentota bacterium]